MSYFIILIGPPGCGKGTQASDLSLYLKANKISMGDLVRNKVNSGDSSVIHGKLINDDFINEIFLHEIISIKDDQNIVLDGYPRTIEQTFFLEKIKKHRKILVFYFKVHYDVLFKRILGRFSCADCGFIYNQYFRPTKIVGVCDFCGSINVSIRSDDKQEVLVNRLIEYDKLTLPILDYYKKLDLVYEIDASQSTDKVLEEVLQIYNKLF
jgi:adenylate kinase